ncbi:MAG: outer membrane beta-barrel protein [Verrucomicrobia bacterium]|nr:outer membrane beta-barrel protein [Verrucomicrobiota bacterium]
MKWTVVLAAAAVVMAFVMDAEGAQFVGGPLLGGAYDELLPVLVRGRTFVPSFKARIEYDDNIFTEETDPVEQWKLVIEPKLDLHILRETTYLGLSYQYSLQIYEDRDPDTDQSHDASLTFNHKFSERVELRVRDRYRRMFEPELVEATVTDEVAGERVVTRRLRNDRDYNIFSPTVIVGVTPKLNGSVTYENVWVDYEDPEVSISGDYMQNSGSLAGNYILSQQTYLTFFYRYQDIDYDSDETKVDSTSNIASIGGTHRFSPTLSGTLQVGVERRTFADFTRTAEDGTEERITDQTQTAPYISASIRAPLSETISTEVGYSYRIEETTEAAFLSQELQSVYLAVSQSFTDRFSTTFNATLDFSEFSIDEARFPETQSTFDEQSIAFALVFRYAISSNWHVEAGWRFTDVDSDFPRQSYRRNRPFVGVSAIF